MNLYIAACMYITVTFFKCVYIVNFSLIGIFSETDEPLDFNKPLVKGSVVNVISMNNNFFVEIIIKKLSAFEIIHFVCNSEENKTLIFHIYCMLQKKKKKE